MDAARGSHTRWQEGHVSVLSVRGAIVANLFSSGAVEYCVRIIRIAKQTLIQAIVPSADKVVTHGDVHEEIDVPCNTSPIGRMSKACIDMMMMMRPPHP